MKQVETARMTQNVCVVVVAVDENKPLQKLMWWQSLKTCTNGKKLNVTLSLSRSTNLTRRQRKTGSIIA